MFVDVLAESSQIVRAFQAECQMLTDTRYLRNRIRNYLIYTDQLFGGEVETAESLTGRPATCPLPTEDFDAALAEKMSLDPNPVEEEGDMRLLMSSARKSLSFLMHQENISAICDGGGAAEYNSEAEDGLGPVDEYAITDHSSNESSNNLTYAYCYCNAKGEPLKGESLGSASFSRFLEEEQRALERGGRKASPPPVGQRFLYCNGKRVPEWASDLEALTKVVAEQKTSGKVFLEAFGELQAVDNLNLECVFGVTVEGNSRRGESAMWNTPESRNCSRLRLRIDPLTGL